MILATGRDFPLFVHVLGAMVLFGAVVAAAILGIAGRPKVFPMLLVVGIPAWLLTFAGGHWIASREHLNKDEPTWVTIGLVILEPGVLILLAIIGFAYWWRRSGKPVAGRIVTGLSAVYLVLLAVAWMAMSGKWG